MSASIPTEVAVAVTGRDISAFFGSAGMARLWPRALVAWTPSGRVIGWNPAAERLFGLTAAQAMALPVGEALPARIAAGGSGPDPPPPIDAGHGEQFADCVLRDGSTVACAWYETDVPVRGDEPGPIRLAVARDVSRYLRAQREHQRLFEIATLANATESLDEILLMVRNTVIDLGGFDRAGVWLVERGWLWGSWGTDERGILRDEHACGEPLEDVAVELADTSAAEIPYLIRQLDRLYVPGRPSVPLEEPLTVGTIALRSRGELVGMLFVDNLLTRRPLAEEELAALLPFGEQTAAAIARARLVAERGAMVERQRRLMGISAAIGASHELDGILRMVRDAVVEVAGFDRAGVFVVDQGIVRGAWGTDLSGQLRDEHDFAEPLEGWGPEVAELASGARRHVLRATVAARHRAAHYEVIVALNAGGELVGLLCVDNVIGHRPVAEEDVRLLLPFADQAAVAIHNARLFRDLRRTQEALMQSENLRAIGELASGVAHNVNNILTAVLGYAELIEQEQSSLTRVRHYARIVARAAMDGAEVVRRVQEFARRDGGEPTGACDLSAVASEAVELTRPAWQNQASSRGASIGVRCNLPATLPASGSAADIREVLVNLIGNAVDAMPAGGDIGIRGYLDGTTPVLEVSDTGIGMDSQTRGRIFEPFFTTKGPGRGTGLGLSVAWGIVMRNGGQIEVETEPGMGALFRLRLRSARACRAPRDAVDAQPPDLRGATLLVVDDEPAVAGSVAEGLRASGARVAVASGGVEALDWLAAHAQDCDAIVTDHAMLGMNGLALLAAVRDRYPQVRRMLLSGWGAFPPDAPDMSVAQSVVAKPAARRALAAALSDLLTRPPN
ncbi:MAG: response regulator [Chthonomonadales bacterium]|nr:response regulator [Chthonomonadales bacterium]